MDVGIDPKAAQAVARTIVPPGPQLSLAEAHDVVADLRSAAAEAVEHVAGHTGLSAPSNPGAAVVDRPGWVQANVSMLHGLLDGLSDARTDTFRPTNPLAARAAGVQVGALLGALSTVVLGQFDPYSARPRLLLVAPNIVGATRKLNVPARDFRRWVCIHEETHRVQFGHAPWLAEHLRGLLRLALADANLGTLSALFGSQRAGEQPNRHNRHGTALDQIVATMSLLEGHADTVTDLAGRETIPSLAKIRRRVDQRRSAGGWARILRRLLSLDAKLRQYAEGAAFCRRVLGEVGMDGLNQVWEGPEWLPTAPEIATPTLWLSRVS